MRVHVRLSCGHSPAPGLDWDVTVEFIGNAEAYRVWSQTDEEPRRVLLKHSSGPLDWRRMIADIRELDDIWLGGDLLSEIEVEGACDWQAALLKMAWCKFEAPADEQLAFLLRLPDDTIARLADRIGDLASPEALEIVARIGKGASGAADAPLEAERAIAQLPLGRRRKRRERRLDRSR